MARAFSKYEAQWISDDHTSLMNDLRGIINKREEFKRGIVSAAGNLIDSEVNKILAGISVDELNRDGVGLRIKSLKDAGFNTIADVFKATNVQLSNVNGISPDGAGIIKNISRGFVNQVRDGVRIRLSVDNKTPEATALVCFLYKYIKINPIYDETVSLLDVYMTSVYEALEKLEPSKGTLKWLFTSKAGKTDAEGAYLLLQDMMRGDYGIRGKELQLRSRYVLETANDFTAWTDFQSDSIRYFTVLEELCPGMLGSAGDVYGLTEELAEEVKEEAVTLDGLKCTLRRYQEWGVKYILNRKRVLLGDEMGLGKTVQAIAAMVCLKNTGATHFAVVCPASVLENWCREIVKHSELSVIKVHGAGRGEALTKWITEGGVAVTTYEQAGHFELEPSFKFDMIVVDEAHYIKNPAAARTRNVKEMCLHTERILMMTGTALENRVDEMISLIDILQPEVATSVKTMAFMSNAPQFRNSVAPVYYRRKRDQVLAELPDLIENMEWCSMNSHEEDAYYKTLWDGNLMTVRRVSWNVEDLQYSTKAQRLKEIVEEAREDDRKIIVFSFFLNTLERICGFLGDACMPMIYGAVPPARRQEIIDEFDKAPAGSVLPAQINTAGTGLNIQAASVVVICEPQYKPSTESQAISRAYRMGQARNVLVYRLMSDDTVDERILEILTRKQAEFDAFADKSVAGEETIGLDDSAMGDIIKGEIERIRVLKGEDVLEKAKNTQIYGLN